MSKRTEATVTVTADEATNVVTHDVNAMLTELKSKSAVIRRLNADGLDCKAIYKLLSAAGWKNNAGTHDIRYQHVRNVLVTPIKKA